MTTLMTTSRAALGGLMALGLILGAGDTRAQSYEHLLTFGSQGSGDGQFILPDGVAVDRAGNIVVADTDNFRIQVFD
jgi:NHL repeat